MVVRTVFVVVVPVFIPVGSFLCCDRIVRFRFCLRPIIVVIQYGHGIVLSRLCFLNDLIGRFIQGFVVGRVTFVFFDDSF